MSKHPKKQERRWRKDTLKKAIHMELREHKSSFIVFYILRFLVIATLIRQFFLGNYNGVFLCLLTIALLYLPSWVQVRLRIELPPLLEIIILCFIFAAEILGEINAFYVVIPMWDTILHTLNGFLCAAVGFALVVLLNDDERLTFDLSPFFIALTSFCFSMTIGVLWEFFEFGMDCFFHTDMQKDTVINALYSVALDTTNSNKAVALPDIQDVIINGQSLGVGGYLDIGIIDTMKDLFVNFIGALVFSLLGFFYAMSKGTQQKATQKLVPKKKDADRDFLKKAAEDTTDDESNPDKSGSNI